MHGKSKLSWVQNYFEAAPETYAYFWIDFQTIRLILVLLNFSCDFGHFSPFRKVNELRVSQIIKISFFNMHNVGEIHPEKWDTWRIYRSQFSLISSIVVFGKFDTFIQKGSMPFGKAFERQFQSMQGRALHRRHHWEYAVEIVQIV